MFFAYQRMPIPNKDMFHVFIFMESLTSVLNFCIVTVYKYFKKISRRYKILQVG